MLLASMSDLYENLKHILVGQCFNIISDEVSLKASRG